VYARPTPPPPPAAEPRSAHGTKVSIAMIASVIPGASIRGATARTTPARGKRLSPEVVVEGGEVEPRGVATHELRDA